MSKYRKSGGFTIIELLIVIGVIAVLASVIFMSVGVARKKAKDAAVRRELRELRNVMELEYSTAGNYYSFETSNNFVPGGVTCASLFTGVSATYQDNVKAICQGIVNASEPPAYIIQTLGAGADYRLRIYGIIYSYATGSPVISPSSFSVMAYLPYKQTYVCMGSNNRMSDTITEGVLMAGGWTTLPGCYDDVWMNP